jgi:hypothetical protein
MHVKVDDGYLFDFGSVLTFEVRGCEGDVVDVAEAVGARFVSVGIIFMVRFAENACMVAGRSRRAKRIPILLTHHSVTRLNHSPGCQKRGLPSLFRTRRILAIERQNNFVPRSRQLLHKFHDFQDVIEVVNFKNICDTNFLHLALHDQPRCPFGELGASGKQPELRVN